MSLLGSARCEFVDSKRVVNREAAELPLVEKLHNFNAQIFLFLCFFCFLGGPFFFSDRLAVKRRDEEEVTQQKAAGWMWTRAAAFQPWGIWAPAQWQLASATHNMVEGQFFYPLKKKK